VQHAVYQQQACNLFLKLNKLKGSLTTDFGFQVFFMNQFPPGPWVSQMEYLEIVKQFEEYSQLFVYC